MLRRADQDSADSLHHVIVRGLNRRAIFRDHVDRQRWQQLFVSTCHSQQWRCLAYCLMTGHLHLLISAPETRLEFGMQWLSARYAESFQRRHRQQQPLFQEQHQLMRVNRDPYLLEVVRYILLNPVRGSLCAGPADWRFSSAAASLGLAPVPAWLDVDIVYGLLGARAGQGPERLARYLNAPLSLRAG